MNEADMAVIAEAAAADPPGSSPDRKLPDEDFTTPEHLLHMSDDELIGTAARSGRTLAKLDERQLMGVAEILFASMLVVMAVLFARQGLKALRGQDPAPIGYRDYG